MRIVILASYPGSLVGFRGELIRAMVSRGHEVVALAPDMDEVERGRLAELGVRDARSVPLRRTGMDPIADLGTLRAITVLLRELRPDVILAYTAKPVIYGMTAAWLARVPLRIALISGRGTALSGGQGWKRNLLLRITRSLYAVSLRLAHVVLFQNPDDEAYFRRHHLVGRKQRRIVVNGSGVDLAHYAQAPLPDPAPITFLMIGRLVREKGVFEYIEAARRVMAAGAAARFRLLGDLDTNPTSISGDQLAALQREGIVEYLGTTKDVRPVIASAHVVVLPSYYGEGVPRSVLEGMSMGRAVLTTDEPGCRETVQAGRNGVRVPARDAGALSAAMLGMIERPDEVVRMGRASRAMAEERFDVHDVNRVILAAMDLA